MPSRRSKSVAAFALGCLAACQSSGSEVAAPSAPADQAAQVSPPESSGSTFAYLLARYDADRDGSITALEYTRHDGQFARWDSDGDQRISEADWSDQATTISPQIDALQRLDLLGRYFQTDENPGDVLTLDELANAFLEYDAAGTLDDHLTASEFAALAEERAVRMPGDGSMMKQSYIGEVGGWPQLADGFDSDGSGGLDMTELAAVFEERDVYELRFDELRFDGAAAGVYFDELAYEAGLVVGSSVPPVTLTSLGGGEPVALAELAGARPMALIFGSYT